MPKTDITCTQLRIDSSLFAKAKILAAVYGDSFNSFVTRLIQNSVSQYERDYGELPRPLPTDELPSDLPKARSRPPRV